MKGLTFNKVILIIFLVFLGVYFASKNSYYDSLSKKKALTEEQIMKFEDDVANNIPLDIDEYLPKDIDNSNFVSRGAYQFSQLLSNLLNDKCKDVWKLIKTLFIS